MTGAGPLARYLAERQFVTGHSQLQGVPRGRCRSWLKIAYRVAILIASKVRRASSCTTSLDLPEVALKQLERAALGVKQ